MKRILTALAGPPCSGKTATGVILAGILDVEFLETDSLIEQNSGKSIAQIFEMSGEAGFRKIEKQTVRRVVSGCHGRPAVIALGGGTLLDCETRTLVESECRVFTLTAPEDILVSRNTGGRPLAADATAFRKLLEDRAAHYLSLPAQVNTGSSTPEEIALMLAEKIRKEAHSR